MNLEVHMNKGLATITLTVAAAAIFAGCGKSADSFSLLADASSYKQNAQYIPRKVDILWVVDNSGTMETSQTNLGNNFPSFIQNFIDKGSDFRMAVTTTDAYLAPYYNQETRSRIRDGAGAVHSGVFVMDKNTPNLVDVFLKNITQGVLGGGDERAFSSFEETLKNPWNAGFRRPDAFLAVIIVSDEDDFSHSDYEGQGLNHYYFSQDYNDPKMHSIQRYVDYLTNFTAVAGAGKNFSVSAISIFDEDCLKQLKDSEQKLALRYGQLVDATGGEKISLCSNFSQSLSELSKALVNLSSSFALNRTPIPESIVVSINGIVIPQGSGWRYDAAKNSIVFDKSKEPAANDDVRISFDPAGVKN